MFKFVSRPHFSAPVRVLVPGVAEPQQFTGHFVAMTQSETEALQGASVPRERMAEANREWLERIFVGWEGVVDDADRPIQFSAETRAQLLDAPFVRQAVTLAYLTEVSGAARKN